MSAITDASAVKQVNKKELVEVASKADIALEKEIEKQSKALYKLRDKLKKNI